MSTYRFDAAQVNSEAYHWGFRGFGVLGSEIANGGAYDGYLFASLSLPTDANKEYWAPIVTIPAGMTNITEFTGFDYEGASTSFNFDVWENMVYLGQRTATINTDGSLTITLSSNTVNSTLPDFAISQTNILVVPLITMQSTLPNIHMVGGTIVLPPSRSVTFESEIRTVVFDSESRTVEF